MENVNVIDYKEILNLVRDELMGIIDENYTYYEGYKFKISEEQFFVKEPQADPKTIFIVLRFSPISVHFGQTIVPFQIQAISEQNNIEICRNLFEDLVAMHNLTYNDDETVQQIFEAPSVSSAFNKVMSGYRTIVSVSATFVISKNANFYKYYYVHDVNGVETETEIPCVTKAFNGAFQLDTQPFFGSNNLTKSEGTVYTLTYSIVTFLLTDIELANDVLKVMCQERDPFEKFKLKIVFKNGKNFTKEFMLIDWNSRVDIGDIPMLTLTFTS